jgi:RNA polymerase sigma-70 factor (ECF subfamily)
MVGSEDEHGRMGRSQNGDHDAFESLIKDYQRMIHLLCYRMTGSLTEAEDLAQETFIRAYQQLKSFRAEARFSSRLYRIAVNQCLNWQKGNQRRQALHQNWAEQSSETGSGNVGGRTSEIEGALLQLNPKQRAAIVLTTYDGLSHAEAAQALGCSETTVSWRLFAARARLKKLLEHLK